MDSQAVASQRSVRDEPTAGTLKPNALGVLGILFLVLSAQAPLTGIAGAVPISVGIGNGPGTAGAYVLVGVVTLLFSVGFVTMGRHVVDAGAFYTYIGTGLGRTTGAGSAGVALFAYCAIQAAMYGLYGSIVSGLVDAHTGLNLPWWVWSLATMAVVQILGATGIDMGAKLLAVFVLAEFSILLVFSLVTLFKGGGPEGLGFTETFSPSAVTQGAPGVAVMFAVASMFGFEATAIYGEEAREPKKTVPRATYLAVVVVVGFFALTSWMLVAAYGPSKAVAAAGKALASGDSTAFVFAPIAAQFGGWVNDVLPVLLATSLFAGLLTFHNSANRYLFSLGRDGLLPRRLCTLNSRHAPWTAGCVQTLVAVALVVPFALAGKDPVLTLFSWFSGVAVLAMMLLYLLTSVSVVVFFRRERLEVRLWNTLIAPVLATIAVAGAVWLILANFTTLIGGDSTTALWLALSVPVVMALSIVTARLSRRGPSTADS
ncbi:MULTISPECIES: APC family permease [unclassified Streptomyces]|uniref:APC family permease n=1 Tax=unclassified Streptomyces TaxID=2593676 RepID=UPI00190AD5F8|nr:MULTISPECIES: APC family permease [unclassified Streptomyces]MBK3565363.1 APC family permease [Streptomyces sp. MBT62]MBK6014303.1 APC family permease [Streptomyces sp. MBT53]